MDGKNANVIGKGTRDRKCATENLITCLVKLGTVGGGGITAMYEEGDRSSGPERGTSAGSLTLCVREVGT